MRVCLLASGSKGNSLYIETKECKLLVDAGLSGREAEKRLAEIGVQASQLHAILVTHEHRDHCHGLGVMARRYRLPVYLHYATHAALPGCGHLPEVRELDGQQKISLRGVEIEPFPVTHDAVAPLGYSIHTDLGKIGIATDLGIATRLVIDRLQSCRVLIIEANHDELMLRDGPYPWHLKQRIRSNHGHLSNGAAADLVQQLLWPGLEAVFLAHLSEENNLPELASESVCGILNNQNLCCPKIHVASQHQVSACFNMSS